MHPHRDHPGVPVVAMQHLGLPDVPGEFGSSTGEEGEAPVLVVAAVDALRVEHRMTHQVDRHPIGGMLRFIDGELGAHGLGSPDRLRRHVEAAPELGVARHDQAHVVAELGQCRGQRANNIAHPSNLDHRGAFRCSEEDAHVSDRRWRGDFKGNLGICSVREEPSPEFQATPGDTGHAHPRCKAAHSHGRRPVPPSSGGGCRGTPWWCIP